MPFTPPTLTKPGLLITGTDTDVGKTVASCAILAAIRQQQRRIRLGVCKPFGSGCRRDREGLVSSDAEALAHFSDCRLPLNVINPLRYRLPLAPAMAAELERQPVQWAELTRSLALLDEQCDAVLIEGVGGLMVPLDPQHPRYMLGSLAKALGYPVIVVCRPNLGTINHTLMTVELLRQAGCRVVGLIINGRPTEATAEAEDPSLLHNRSWLERLTGVKVLAELPRGRGVDVARGRLDPAILAAAMQVQWIDHFRIPGTW